MRGHSTTSSTPLKRKPEGGTLRLKPLLELRTAGLQRRLLRIQSRVLGLQPPDLRLQVGDLRPERSRLSLGLGTPCQGPTRPADCKFVLWQQHNEGGGAKGEPKNMDVLNERLWYYIPGVLLLHGYLAMLIANAVILCDANKIRIHPFLPRFP